MEERPAVSLASVWLRSAAASRPFLLPAILRCLLLLPLIAFLSHRKTAFLPPLGHRVTLMGGLRHYCFIFSSLRPLVRPRSSPKPLSRRED